MICLIARIIVIAIAAKDRELSQQKRSTPVLVLPKSLQIVN